MGILEGLAEELGIEKNDLESALKKLINPKKIKALEKSDNPANLFIKFYCDEFKKIYSTFPTIDGKAAGLAKSLVKDLGLAKCQALMVTYLQMRRRDFTLKHHDLVTFKFNLNAITVQNDRGRSIDHYDAKQIGLHSHNKSVVERYIKETECEQDF